MSRSRRWKSCARTAWPGNIRELKNTVACALAFAEKGILEPHHLRFVANAAETSLLDRCPLGGQTLASIEQAAIKQTLAQTHGNKVHAAQAAGHRLVDAVREDQEVRDLIAAPQILSSSATPRSTSGAGKETTGTSLTPVGDLGSQICCVRSKASRSSPMSP